jgi:hypothetical protein
LGHPMPVDALLHDDVDLRRLTRVDEIPQDLSHFNPVDLHSANCPPIVRNIPTAETASSL